MITIKLELNRYVVMAMMNVASTGSNDWIITTPTGDIVKTVQSPANIAALEAALAAGDIFVDLSADLTTP
jgi:hypothetical protein